MPTENFHSPFLPADASVAALVGRLSAAEKDLASALGPDADAVVDSNGHAHLLRQAQAALQHSEHRFRTLIEKSSDVITMLAADGTVLYESPAASRTLGYAPAERIGRSGFELLHPDDAAQAQEVFAQLNASPRATATLMLQCRHRDGSYRNLEGTCTNLLDEPGVNAFVLNYRDITARIRAEEAERANAAFTEDILNSLQAQVAVLDEHGIIIAVNESWRRFARESGASSPDSCGQNYLDVCRQSAMREDAAAETEEGIRRLLEGSRAHFTLEYSWRAPSGQRWFRLRASRLGGGRRGVVVSHQDISEYRLAMEALRASEARFKALFEQAAVGVAQTDVATLKYVQANRRFCEILGYRAEELQQLTFVAITHPEDVSGSLETLHRLTAGELREATWEKRFLRKDGAIIWATLTVSAMWDPGEAPTACIAVMQDITARKQLEGHLRQAQKMDALGTLAGGIAHDFNNILGSIHGYTELALLVLKENAPVREHLGAVLKASNRAIDLVRQILTFSRKQKLELRAVQMHPLVEESLKLLRATIPATIEFETMLAADAPPVLADPTQIHQVLMNLGTNAWHAMGDRSGRLEVRLERCAIGEKNPSAEARLRPGVYARLSVRDSGCGMDAETLRRIFEPFFTTKLPGEGTGLGLAVVHGIMESHGGAVTVLSRPGEGTVFHLYFPAHQGLLDRAAGEQAPVPHGQGQRILFVDDEEWLVQLAKNRLPMLGYEVEIATSPTIALDRVRSDPGRFSLVFSDLSMPGMTGLELASALRAVRPDLPIILMTGYSAGLSTPRLEAAGVRQLLLKPISFHALGTAAHAALHPPAAGA